jgi:plasmid stability protein
VQTKLRIRAAHNRRSMEEEARNILRTALGEDSTAPVNLAEAVHQRFRPFGGIELSLPLRAPMRKHRD